MTRIAVFAPQVEREILRIRRRYNKERAGLGDEFWSNLQDRAAFLCEYANTGTLVGAGFRRIKIKRFPYNIYFRTEPQVIWIIAIFHNKQDR